MKYLAVEVRVPSGTSGRSSMYLQEILDKYSKEDWRLDQIFKASDKLWIVIFSNDFWEHAK